MATAFDLLFLLLICLNICDAVLTAKAISLKKGSEGNPFMAAVMRKVGVDVALALVKFASLIYIFDKYWSALPTPESVTTIGCLCVLFAAICVWNYRVLKKG